MIAQPAKLLTPLEQVTVAHRVKSIDDASIGEHLLPIRLESDGVVETECEESEGDYSN